MGKPKRKEIVQIPAHPKPRNPLVALAHQRHAGAHASGNKALRQQANLAIRREAQLAVPALRKHKAEEEGFCLGAQRACAQANTFPSAPC